MVQAIQSALFGSAFEAAGPLAQAAFAALWQSAAIAFVLGLCLRMTPRIPAAYRFAAWAAGFATAVALPFAPTLARMTSTGATSGSGSVAGGATAWFALDSRWALAVAVLWIAASVARVAQLAWHTLRLRGLWRSAKPVGDRALAALCGPRQIEVCTTAALDRPSAIGFFRPRILLPEWIFARLSGEELEQVILHEAEHLRRRDDWTNLLQKLALVVFPLDPALLWMERQLAREREMACDEAVVRRTGAPRAYAACLASLAESSLQRREIELRAAALALGAWRKRPELVERVHSILWGKKTVAPVAARALLAAVGCMIVVAAAALARCPQMVAFVAAPPQDVALAAGPPTNLAPAYRVVETKAVLPAPRSARQRAVAAPTAQTLVARFKKSEAQTTAAQPAQWMVLTAWEQAQSLPARPRAAEAGETDEVIAQPGAALPSGMIVTRVIVTVESSVASPQSIEEQPQILRLRLPQTTRQTTLRMTGLLFHEPVARNAELPARYTEAGNQSASGKVASAPSPENAPPTAAPTHSTNSHSLQPAARLPLGGWLVFEL
jgi:beta-lactamase regulating signal transducer with metallopeptidase domain